MFRLHPQLDQDTYSVGYFSLSQLLLAKDANYPWCILVPQREVIREIHHLDEKDQHQLLKESCALARVMEALFKPDKINVAAIGNVVPQLHVHHVARFETDAVWPKPIWAAMPPKEYDQALLKFRLQQLRDALKKAEVEFDE